MPRFKNAEEQSTKQSSSPSPTWPWHSSISPLPLLSIKYSVYLWCRHHDHQECGGYEGFNGGHRASRGAKVDLMERAFKGMEGRRSRAVA